MCVCAGDVDLEDLIANLPPKGDFSNFKMEPAEFEKVRGMLLLLLLLLFIV